MKILSRTQIQDADQFTIENEPVRSSDLMERAALACSNWIKERYTKFLNIKIFVGPGNNGGDGLCIAYHLLMAGYQVQTFILSPREKFSQDAMLKFQRLIEHFESAVTFIQDPYIPALEPSFLIVDALFGTGLSRPLSGYPSYLISQINKSGAEIISIDMPSGLFCDTNEGNNRDTIIKADHTLTFEMPKLSYMFAENYMYTGEVHILKIGLHPKGIDIQESKNFYQTIDDFKEILKTREKFSHKGTYGHALLISGSFGKMGAAVLASKACLRTGVGLLTTHIPRKGYDILQSTVPEAMVSLDNNFDMVSQFPENQSYDAIGIGPGIGTSNEAVDLMREVMSKITAPLVIDADALNILAYNQWLLTMLPQMSVLTPHPKEFDRLAGDSINGYKRFLNQLDFSEKYNVIIVLKGAHTSITTPKGFSWFNSTGNPGMSTAGSGDVLTGMILALLAQGYNPSDAARLGVFVHGLAGDLALSKNSVESLLSSDIINYIGHAFNHIRNS